LNDSLYSTTGSRSSPLSVQTPDPTGVHPVRRQLP
jgi:hypothetical protein